MIVKLPVCNILFVKLVFRIVVLLVNVFVPPTDWFVVKSQAVPTTDAIGIVPDVIEAPLITGADENVFTAVIVCVEFKLTAVPETDATGIVPELIFAPDNVGAVENVLAPLMVCDVVKSIAVPTTAPIGMVELEMDAPLIIGGLLNVCVALNVFAVDNTLASDVLPSICVCILLETPSKYPISVGLMVKLFAIILLAPISFPAVNTCDSVGVEPAPPSTDTTAHTFPLVAIHTIFKNDWEEVKEYVFAVALFAIISCDVPPVIVIEVNPPVYAFLNVNVAPIWEEDEIVGNVIAFTELLVIITFSGVPICSVELVAMLWLL